MTPIHQSRHSPLARWGTLRRAWATSQPARPLLTAGAAYRRSVQSGPVRLSSGQTRSQVGDDSLLARSLARATVVSPAVVAMRETADATSTCRPYMHYFSADDVAALRTPGAAAAGARVSGRGGINGCVRRRWRAGDGQCSLPIATFILLILQCFCGVFIIYATVGEVLEFRKIGRGSYSW